MRSSVLVPLSQKTNSTVANTGLLNPKVGTSLSSTPSPTATPTPSRSLDNMILPSISAAPSPAPVSSSLLAPLPAINLSSKSSINKSLERLNALPPSPRLGQAPSPVSSTPVSSLSMATLPVLPPSPRSGKVSSSVSSSVSSAPVSSAPVSSAPVSSSSLSMATLPVLPPSPRSGKVSSVPVVSNVKTEQSINNSLTNLRSLPPSPLPLSRNELFFENRNEISLERLGKSSDNLPMTGSLLNVPEGNLKPLSHQPTFVDKTETAMSFHDHKGMIEDSTVEKTLAKSGFLPVDKVLTKDENDNLICQYIKAVDPTGRTVYVDLDCEGYVAVDPENMTMTNASKASVVPYSSRIGTYECVSSDVCGVAFECDNEICTLKRSDNNLTPSETVFTNINRSGKSIGHKQHGMLSNHPISYPIVSMSHIQENPELVACSIKDSHNRMRNVAFNQTNRDTSNLVEASNSLNNEVRRFDSKQRNVASKLNSTIEQLETAHDSLKRKPPVTDKGRANLRSVRYNLRRRHDLVVDHLKVSEAVNSRLDRINELLGEIKTLNEYSDRLFEGVEYEYQE